MQARGAPVSVEVLLRFTGDRAIKIDPPVGTRRQGQGVEQRPQPFAHAELPGKNDPKIGGRGALARMKDALVRAVRNLPDAARLDPEGDQLLADHRRSRTVPIRESVLL